MPNPDPAALASPASTGQAVPAPAPFRASDPLAPLEDDILFHPDGTSISEEAADELAARLGLPAEVVYAMPIAWQENGSGQGCWLVPETDGAGHRVGTMTFDRDGRWAPLPGSRRGLSEPDEWDLGHEPLLLPVGVWDTLALTTLKLPALGRPGNTVGLDDLARRLRGVAPGRPLLLLAGGAYGDATAAGPQAAGQAAAELGVRLGRPVAWAVLPDGAPDLRAWLQGKLKADLDPACRAELGRLLLGSLRPQASPGVADPGITADELLRRDLPEPAWVVPALLPEGVTILAGKPKSGKSWLALQLALAVAGGATALGAAAAAGDVLYLALEDTPRRLKARLGRLLAGAAPAPARLTLMTSWRRLEEGGRDDLLAWLGTHAGARLVVLDTLARLRSRRRDAAYEDDYGVIAAVQQLAARCGVGLLIVHHVRKQIAEDPFDAVSGTLGLTGAADAVWVLCRSRRQREAVLHVTGRDVDEQELALAWDAAAGRWSLLGPAEEHRLSKERALVLDVLARAGRPLTPTALAPLLEKKPAATKVLLWRMAERGQVVSEDGAYGLPGPGRP